MPTSREVPPYTKDTLYKDAMKQLQAGQWQSGLTQLNQLESRYPTFQTQLQELQAEMAIRSRIDEYEVEEVHQARLNLFRKYGLYALIAIVAGLILYYVIGTYAGFVQTQVDVARQQMEEQSEYLQLLATYRNAQNLFRAGRAIAASAMFEQVNSQIQAKDYPHEADTFINLPQELEQSRTVAGIEEQYNQAMDFLGQEKRLDALALFRKIEAWDPRYRDVSLQIGQLETYFDLESVFERAEAAYAAEDWSVAIDLYELARDQNPAFKTKEIEDRLFQAYLNIAQAILDKEESMEQLKVAEEYFAKALALRPQDPATMELRSQARKAVEDALIATYLKAAQEALVNQANSLEALAKANEYYFKASQVRPNDPLVAINYEMARRYLATIEEFNRGDWDLVITDLEYVYSEDSSFAAGTAAQTLYDAYLARGGNSIGAADYEAALVDFKRAAEIANANPNAVLLAVQAQVEMARALGLLARYDEAVAMYQDAITKGNLDLLARAQNPTVYNNLVNAQLSVDVGNYKMAYTYYRNALENLTSLLATSTHVVKEGEYLSSLARQYNTTVEAIMQANNITSRRIEKNQALIIPNLKK